MVILWKRLIKRYLEFINECYEKNIKSINVITGKGLRSKNIEDPYSSLI